MPPRSHAHPRCRALLGVLLKDSDIVHRIEAIPRDVDIENNSHREADTARCTFSFEDLPLDVRRIRSVHVALFLGDVESADHELNLEDERFLAFEGLADEPETVQDDRGEWVTLACRDYTGVWLDTLWPGGFLDIARPLRQVVETMLSLVPGTEGLEVVFDGGTEGLQLSAQLGRTVWTPDAGDDCWTVLVTLLGQVGLTPVIRLATLWINVAGTSGSQHAAFTYGVNVQRLTTRRSLHRRANSTVRVVAYNEATGQVLESLWPEGAETTSRQGVKGGVVQGAPSVLSFYVSGAFSQGDLRGIAQRIYEQRSRQGIDGTLVTTDLWDEDDEARLPLLANGDILTLRQQDVLATSIRGMSEGEAIAFLTSGHDPLDQGAAQALVSSMKQADRLSVRFFVKTARHRWSHDRGYELEVDFINAAGE